MVIGDPDAGPRPHKSTGSVRPSQPRTSSLLLGNGRHDVKHPLVDGGDIDDSPMPEAARVALAALSTLPTPILVLSSSKTVLIANTAVRKLLGVDHDEFDTRPTDNLKGQTLSQLGIDMISDGVPIWVSWEKFLDNLANGLQPAQRDRVGAGGSISRTQDGETTPTEKDADRGRATSRTQPQKSQDTVVDVIISSRPDLPLRRMHRRKHNKPRSGVQATCRMIISIWIFEGQRFFTLTFTSSAGSSSAHSHASTSTRNTSSRSTRSSHSSQSRTQTPASSAVNSQVVTPSPTEQADRVSFPSIAPPPQCTTSSTLSDFQKVLKMKDAMLRAVEIPLVAMWKDESVVFPNLAARKLLEVEADASSENSYDFMSRFRPWSPDFSQEISEDADPILSLCRTQQAFTNWQVGLLDPKKGKRFNFDVSGHPVFDERTGEFLAGLIAFKDVTEYTEQIASKTAENEEQFRLICDMMPQMIWTATPEGLVNYWSQRWYDYTGLTPATSLGLDWTTPFHEDDMPETIRRWQHSLATGVEYATEYRCRSANGQWRWMLGRALPLRDLKNGTILKWFGTCTDIQAIADAKVSWQTARQQLLDVLKHSQMTLWILDRKWNVTFCEGDSVMGSTNDTVVGSPILNVVEGHLTPLAVEEFKESLSRLLSGASDLEIHEHEAKSRWFRSKMIPLKGKTGPNGVEDQDYIAGVILIGSDVTGLRRKEQENITLLANETAAKAASKMKSSFLANMSHEIRTPIAGVLGMSELLMDTNLDTEQSEFAQNIQRSANSLLTVINDILDFSKIESGRLDIEEVQFSLGVVLRDVAKMLSFAAQRKGLQFTSDVQLGTSEEELILLGDPGRIRQILVNLLTNSIKFTSEGYVKMSTRLVGNTSHSVTVEFCVEDSGIGIEEDVKKRLFQPFSQADSSTARRFGGTGLGLTISKNLVDLMQGTIRLDSKLDAGTIATFTVPFQKVEYQGSSPALSAEVGSMPDRISSDQLSMSITSSPKPQSRSFGKGGSSLQSAAAANAMGRRASTVGIEPGQHARESGISRDSIHILVVEDNPVNQQIALRFIKALKFSARAVWNGREALEYLLKATSPDATPDQATEYPVPSLILMDVQMPILDGYHATHMLRYHSPFKNIGAITRIPIVAMTASAIQGDREKCEKAGMDDYMAKPVKRSLLESKILKWVSGSRIDHKQRLFSEAGADSQESLLGRSCTDRSSTCPQNDAIVAEFYAQNNIPGTQADASGGQASGLATAPQSDMEHAVARRSSISRAILEAEIPGNETENVRATRRAADQDQASVLRDAKLMLATSEHGHSHVVPVSKVDDECSSDLQAAVPVAGTFPLELTEANMYLLNHAQDGAFPMATRSPSPGSQSLTTYPVSNIPGPPPRGNLSAIGLARVDADTQALVTSILETAHPPADSPGDATEMQHSSRSEARNRGDAGRLSRDDRQYSDRSISTTRPEKN